MLQRFTDNGAWFRPRLYGYGPGLPFKWQGWAVIALYLLALGGIGLLSKQDAALPRAATFALFLIVTGLFLMLVRRRTEGGWKWRWGGWDRYD